MIMVTITNPWIFVSMAIFAAVIIFVYVVKRKPFRRPVNLSPKPSSKRTIDAGEEKKIES